MRFFTILLILLIASASAQKVEEITNLNLTVLVDNKAHFKYEFTIKNLIDKPLVPGISEMRLQKVEPINFLIVPIPFTEHRSAVKVDNLRAYSGNMNFKTSFEEKEDYSIIYYEIWYPIEPYSEMRLVLEFDADLVDQGILFKSVTVPVGGDVDIRNINLDIRSDWKTCYIEPKELKSIPAGHLAFITAEFSLLPLPMLPIRGYILFWGFVILVLGIAVVFRRK
ncbi:MAG: hypothetical protein QXQ38_06945 [Archaeoglobaceae archaeon]|nr:hypothetical protein [Archaeoglobales archaeon]MDI9643153.1 hypothetical protein [Archaeoglobales archaeon]